jgi:hypothetical protein
MAMRVLSGVIVPSSDYKRSGSATIDFYPHGVTGNVVQVAADDTQEIGPDAPFNGEPCKIVSLRKIKFSDQDHSQPRDAVNADGKKFSIWDNFTDRSRQNGLVVSWDTDGRGAEIEKIDYMIIGDAG